MSREIKFAPGTPKDFKAAIEHLVEQAGVPSENLDGALDGKRDGQISEAEFIHFVYNSPDWQKYLPALDKAGLKHPLDIHKLPKPILERIAQLRQKIDGEIKLTPNDARYCDAFVPKFYETGLATYAKGGLGFDLPVAASRETHELTASEAYQAVLHPGDKSFEYGSCSEATYKIMSAFRAAGVPCDIVAVETKNHMFPRYKTIDLDPSIGAIDWEHSLDRAGLAAAYFDEELGAGLMHGALQPAERILFASAYKAITGRTWDVNGFNRQALMKLKDAIRKRDAEAIFQECALLISNHSENDHNIIFDAVYSIEDIPKKECLALLQQLLNRFPENPYVLWVIIDVYSNKRASLPRESDLQRISNPSSGNAEYILAIDYKNKGDLKKYEELLDQALVKNPNHTLALLAKADLVFKEGKGDVVSVAQLVQKAVALAPNFFGSYSLISKIALMQGDVEKAYKYGRKFFFHTINESSILVFGYAALKARHEEKSFAILQPYFTSRSLYKISSYLLMAQLALNIGKKSAALEYAQTALKLAKTDEDKAAVSALLKQIKSS